MDDGAAGGLEAPSAEERFAWIEFYEAVADKLLEHRSDRRELVQGIHRIADAGIGLPPLTKSGNENKRFPLKDICPFTVMGIFNRNMGERKRSRIAGELADLLGVGIKPPDSLAVGTPLIAHENDLFFTRSDHIDALWKVLAAAIRFSDSGRHREEFAQALDEALASQLLPWANGNVFVGLYWARPRTFLALDQATLAYLRGHLGFRIGGYGFGSEEYLWLRDHLKGRFMRDGWFVGSFPELTAEARAGAWRRQRPSAPPAAYGKPVFGSPLRPDAERKAEVPVAGPDGSPPTPLEDFVERTRGLPRNTVEECRAFRRIGQDVFRANLLKFWQGRCPLTGINHGRLLRAGHMMPWAVCDADERLDVHNGLLLAVHLDAAFDAGLISFEMDGTLLVSSELSSDDKAALGLPNLPRLQDLRPKHERFLAYHRHKVFQSQG